jgi:predicted transcriptional regulator
MTPTAHAETEHTTPLTKTDQKRLERLAKSAGRTPQAMLRFVLRDGFAVCEEDVAESIAADREFEQGKSMSHESVMQAAAKLLQGAPKRA